MERGLPKGLLLAALFGSSAASSTVAFDPSTLLASLTTGDRTYKACLLVFLGAPKKILDTAFLLWGGAGAAMAHGEGCATKGDAKGARRVFSWCRVSTD